MGAYQQYVETRTGHNPCLTNLAKFLSNPRRRGRHAKIVSMDFYGDISGPEKRDIELEGLSQLLDDFNHQSSVGIDSKSSPASEELEKTLQSEQYLKILLVQDLSKDIIESLGTSLNIDPTFFASHIHASVKGVGVQTPDMAVLPSRIRRQNYINIHYHRTLVFENAWHLPKKLLREGNLERKVILLPWSHGKHIGLAQHCISILYVNGPKYGLG